MLLVINDLFNIVVISAVHRLQRKAKLLLVNVGAVFLNDIWLVCVCCGPC